MRVTWTGVAKLVLIGGVAWALFAIRPVAKTPEVSQPAAPVVAKLPSSDVAAKIVAAAHKEVAEAAVYTTGYVRISYPNGDLPRSQGVCTDVVIRALRGAGFDLQKLIHEDIVKHFSAYPRREEHPDSNIDHRRVPNQMFFFKRFGTTLATKSDKAHIGEWKPGDIVYWKLPSGLDHAGVVSDSVGKSGLPMVIHNLDVCREEDALGSWQIQGHFRYPKS